MTARARPGTQPRLDFIVGLPRSGSTWLSYALGRHPDVAVFGETSFFGRLFVPPRADGTYGRRELERVRTRQHARGWQETTGDSPPGLVGTSAAPYPALVDDVLGRIRPPVRPAEVLSAIASEVARHEGKARVVEKTPHHVHWLPRLASSYPDARFVVTFRDPYEFAVSFLGLGRRLPTRTARALDLPWRHPLVAALFWRSYASAVERALAQYPDRTLLVRLEEVRERPSKVLAGVQAFLELPQVDLAGAEGANSSFAGAVRPPPDGVTVAWMNAVSGRAIRRSGYTQRPANASLPSAALSLLAAPLSVAATVARIPALVPGPLISYVRDWRLRWTTVDSELRHRRAHDKGIC
jgi:hypothetical protein